MSEDEASLSSRHLTDSLLPGVETCDGNFTYTRHMAAEADPQLRATARRLAERIVELRCGGRHDHFELWRLRASGGAELPARVKDLLGASLLPGFGLPSHQAPPDHLEAAVAEHLWYFLAIDGHFGSAPRFALKPSFSPLDHGGDGLAVHETANGLSFRLWEVKKTVSEDAVNATASRACRQLEERALQYIARWQHESVGQPDADIVALLDQLADLWLDRSGQAGAGFSIAAATASLPAEGCPGFGDHLAWLDRPEGRRGALQGFDDFRAFAALVQEELWKGL
ncbi:MAG: hypothetical protein IT204_26315 [Fimbriimonadaceae bacterium]|nr:hypothetical protein [Fimbriimonadaceae bacterium]